MKEKISGWYRFLKAQGATKQKAIRKRAMIDYTVDVNDSVMTFDSNIQFKQDAVSPRSTIGYDALHTV
jgi:hypothetical protein